MCMSSVCSEGHLCWRKLEDNDPKRESHFCRFTLLERRSLFSRIIHHYICDAMSASSSVATEELSTALNRQTSYWGRAAPGKAQPQVTTQRLADVPGIGFIFGISVLASSFFRREVCLFDTPSIT